MIRISNIKLPYNHSREELEAAVCRAAGIGKKKIKSISIVKQSIDARKKPDIMYVYTVDVETDAEKEIIRKRHASSITAVSLQEYVFPEHGDACMDQRPVIIGTGPAGLFCGYMLALHGYRPILLERGSDVDERTACVERFWKEGILDPQTNVSFGEGGAGTFSDGKLNTLVHDTSMRNTEVLKIFVRHGAPEDILYTQKPHIGTDVLRNVIKEIRNTIINNGGEVRFNSCMTDIDVKDSKVAGIWINGNEYLECSQLVAATGHSARDTFAMLEKYIIMEPKPFAVGVRIEHPQEMINMSQYGMKKEDILGAASYKLTYKASNGRGVYTFCMCPGGYVVNASTEKEAFAVNGMSYHDRNSRNANSALIVTVTPEDFPDRSCMGGVEFQRKLERAAFLQGQGKLPVQLLGDFEKSEVSKELGDVEPCIKGAYGFGNLRKVLPEELSSALCESFEAFDRKIKGFGRKDAVLTGVESRTSSPLRMIRNEQGESSLKGFYPCGEGAGYAGGITSAAMDGIKAAEHIAGRYRPF